MGLKSGIPQGFLLGPLHLCPHYLWEGGYSREPNHQKTTLSLDPDPLAAADDSQLNHKFIMDSNSSILCLVFPFRIFLYDTLLYLDDWWPAFFLSSALALTEFWPPFPMSSLPSFTSVSGFPEPGAFWVGQGWATVSIDAIFSSGLQRESSAPGRENTWLTLIELLFLKVRACLLIGFVRASVIIIRFWRVSQCHLCEILIWFPWMTELRWPESALWVIVFLPIMEAVI